MKRIINLVVMIVLISLVSACSSTASNTNGSNSDQNTNSNSSGENVAKKNNANSDGNYPNRSIRNIVPFSAGGTTDVNQRIIEKFWKDYFPENMVIEYKKGAGGEVGFTELAKSKPDGYTMGSINTPHIILQPLGRPTEFETDGFDFIARLVHDPQVLAVKADSEIDTLEKFIEKSKEKPGSLTVGMTGTLTGDHLTTLKIMDAAGIKVTPIPLAGSADQVKQLLGGHIDAIVGNVGDVTKDPDQFNILAVATEERHEWLPDVPTFKEQGIDLVAAIDRGLALPKGSPKEVKKMIYSALEKIVALPEYQEKMKEAGLVDGFMAGDKWREQVLSQQKEAERVLKKYGVLK